MNAERRSEPRTAVAIPVELDGQVALTRDVSSSGIYFVVTEPMPVASTFTFTLVFESGGPTATRVPCCGRLIRIDVDEFGTSIGVAATIESFGADAMPVELRGGDVATGH